MKNVLKKASFYILLALGLFIMSLIETYAAPVSKAEQKQARQSKKQIIRFVRQNYRGYKVQIAPAEQTADVVIENRVGKRIIYVDIFRTKSRGGYGVVTTAGPFKGNRMKYERKHKKNSIVLVYLVYDPSNNYSDGIMAFAEAGKFYNRQYY